MIYLLSVEPEMCFASSKSSDYLLFSACLNSDALSGFNKYRFHYLKFPTNIKKIGITNYFRKRFKTYFCTRCADVKDFDSMVLCIDYQSFAFIFF